MEAGNKIIKTALYAIVLKFTSSKLCVLRQDFVNLYDRNQVNVSAVPQWKHLKYQEHLFAVLYSIFKYTILQ